MQRAGLSHFDMLATLTAFTARSLALNYELHLPSLPQTVVLTGGGAANPILISMIRAALNQNGQVDVVTSDSLGWPVQTIEPAAFAFLAFLRVNSLPGNLAQTTGASRAVRLGQISEP
jgi:anhydro-N-acetylmuramic acid kinase